MTDRELVFRAVNNVADQDRPCNVKRDRRVRYPTWALPVLGSVFVTLLAQQTVKDAFEAARAVVLTSLCRIFRTKVRTVFSGA